MKTIYKLNLKTIDEQQISMPEGAEILTVQLQNGEPKLWALVDTDKPQTKRYIEIFGTGNPIVGIGPRKYISTYQLQNGSLVFHVFEYLGL